MLIFRSMSDEIKLWTIWWFPHSTLLDVKYFMGLSQNYVHRSPFHAVPHSENNSYTRLFLGSALNEDTSQKKRSLSVAIWLMYRFTVNSIRHTAEERHEQYTNSTQNSSKRGPQYTKLLASILKDLKWWVWQLHLELEHASSLPHTQCLMLVCVFIYTCTTPCVYDDKLMWYPAKSWRQISKGRVLRPREHTST